MFDGGTYMNSLTAFAQTSAINLTNYASEQFESISIEFCTNVERS